MKKFDAYEIHAVGTFRVPGQIDETFEEQMDDDEVEAWDPNAEQFDSDPIKVCWTLFGHVTGEGLFTIGDFDTREEAEAVMARMPNFKEVA